MTKADAWNDILNPNETILWQGRPEAKLTLGIGQIVLMTFGVIFAACAAILAFGGFSGGDSWTLMIGLAFLFFGAEMVLLPILGPMLMRKYTWYTLTNQRAFIARDLPVFGRSLASYPITPDTDVTFVQGPPDSIHFAKKTRRAKAGTSSSPIGFERIPDGNTVYDLFQQIKRGTL